MSSFPLRASGVLLHPSSLPGPHGIGDLGDDAIAWLDWLAGAETELWQILPLGPTGYGDSPYQCFSAFAGNPYLISLDRLVSDGLLEATDLADVPAFPTDRVDYGAVIPWKVAKLNLAFERFRQQATPLRDEFAAFHRANAAWVDDFGVFMALKDHHDLRPWWEWDLPLRLGERAAIDAALEGDRARIERHIFRQFLFFRQWTEVRKEATARGISIVGDIPIFVAPDSSDVWGNPSLFRLDAERNFEVVAGVPPDYFSVTGQLWGNPLYDWDRHAAEDYTWWISRIEAMFGMVDILRIDHFRGFADYWEIPADAPTAQTGRWLDGPGMAFFDHVRTALGGELPIIAEDLGDLSPAVPKLLRATGLPGMKILQFAFDADETHEFLPHNYPEHCVAYTGTHDNETGQGWWDSSSDELRDWAMSYLETDGADISRTLIETVWQSRAMFAVTPLQTLMRLGSEGRMNYPGIPAGNWQWRYWASALTDALQEELRSLNHRYERRLGC